MTSSIAAETTGVRDDLKERANAVQTLPDAALGRAAEWRRSWMTAVSNADDEEQQHVDPTAEDAPDKVIHLAAL